MKVGFITLKKHYKIAGTEKVLSQMVKSFKNKNIDVKTYFIYEPENIEFLADFDDYSTAYVPRFLRKKHLLRPRLLYKVMHNRGVKKLFDEIQKDDLDILLILKVEDYFLQYFDLVLGLKKANPQLKIVSWPHCSLNHMLEREASYPLKLGVFDAHFAISDGLEEQLRNELNQDNVVTVYNPINASSTVVRRSINKFIYIGRIDENKRVVELLESLSKLSNKDWTLDIIGSAGSDERDRLFMESIHKYGLADNVVFHGWKDDPWAHIEAAGVLLLNSLAEGFALVLVEAMMRGIPCISTDCPVGPASIIQEGFNGWLVDVHDDQKLLGLLEGILAGEISLPPTEQVRNSVYKFETKNVVNNFIQQMYNVIESDKGIDHQLR